MDKSILIQFTEKNTSIKLEPTASAINAVDVVRSILALSSLLDAESRQKLATKINNQSSNNINSKKLVSIKGGLIKNNE